MPRANPDAQTGEVNLVDPHFTAQPQELYAHLNQRCPVSRAMITGSPIISRYEDVMYALRHPEIFSSEMDVHIGLGTERPMIPQQIDPPRQTMYRKILDLRFSRKQVLAIEPEVRAHANQLIDRFIDRGECEFDQEFAIPLPCTAFLHLMGLPVEELDTFLEMKNGIIRPPVPPADLEASRAYRTQTGKRIYAYFENLIDERTRDPRDDIMTHLVTAEIDGRKLTHDEILDICFLFLLGGLDTVTASLGCSIAFLASHPEHRAKLAGDPSQVDGAVEELLRWETPVMMLPRVLKQDVTVAGVDLQAGALVTLLIGAANIDESEFVDGETVDFQRERNRHLAFGGGVHRCLGSHFARMELRVALEEWHRRIPDYSIKPGETPRYSPGIREVQYLPLVWPSRAA